MSLRGFFSRNTDSHRRRKNALTSAALTSRVEHLEDRVLLSADIPGLTSHGISFSNTNVLSSDISFFAVSNPRLSNNALGSGLNVDLDGSRPFGNPPTSPVIPQVNNVNYSASAGNLVFDSNGNAGSKLSLRNMTLNDLVIDAARFTNNGSGGLIISLTNVNVNTIRILNSQFLNNGNNGLCLDGTNVNVNTILLSNNTISNNSRTTPTAANAGALLRFKDSRLGQVSLVGNVFTDNGGHGLHLDLDNTSLSNLEMNGNTFNTNARNGNFAGAFLDFQDSDVGGTITNNVFSGNLFQPNPFNPNLTQGEGLLVQTRRSTLPSGVALAGLRKLELGTVRGNTFTNNGGAGAFFDLGQNTTLRSVITANTVSGNGRTGLNIQAKDTQNAFDVQIGGTTTNAQGNLIDPNTITANRGAGVVVSLDDSSGVLDNTSGRFRLLNNVISNNLDDGLPNTEFAGEGLFVRVRGSVGFNNGAARLLNSRIDGNTIQGNASHGMMFDISEDSEVIDLLIGDVQDPTNINEAPEGDGFFSQGQLIRNSGNLVTGNGTGVNGGAGLFFFRRDAALVQDVRVIDNLFSANTGNGISYIVRNEGNVINSVTIQHNDITANGLNGVRLDTLIDASLVAQVDNNLISGNTGDGILTFGFRASLSDAETLGGTFTRNTIESNTGRGINISNAFSDVGAVTPLVIGGFDSQGLSLGNLIRGNDNDGIEVNGGRMVDIIGNTITDNGQANITGNVHGDGKGIDINLNDVGAPVTTVTDFESTIAANIVEGNRGDGLEIIARLGVSANFLVLGNSFDLNLGRGVDVLNSGGSDMYLVFGDGTVANQNNVRSNGIEGFYAVNTTSTTQTQDVDAITTMVADAAPTSAASNLTLDINTNRIQQNGDPFNLGQLNGSGLVIRVGTSGARTGSGGAASAIPDYEGYTDAGFFFQSDPGFNSVGTSNSAQNGNGRVNARVNGNTFGGNRGVDVITESFVSTTAPATTGGTWNGTTFNVTSYESDPLARLNLQFTNNTGDSVDLVRSGASYNNAEPNFKSRTNGRTAPDPDGPFSSGSRSRNAQRLVGRGEPFTNPNFGFGGLLSGFGGSGTISNMTPGSGMTPIIVTTAAAHGLSSGDTVLLSTGTFFPDLDGFTIENVFEIEVIDANNFALVDTQGETDIDDFFPGMSFIPVTSNAFLYPGIGPSTFRIIEGGNLFASGNDFTVGSETFVPGGPGERTYTFDREQAGAFNFSRLDVSDAQVMEGGQLQFAVTLDAPLPVDLEIFYHTEFAGSAISDVDYVNTTGSIIIPANSTTGTISINTLQDSIFEGSEFFKLVIDSAEATFVDPFDASLSYTVDYSTAVDQFAIGTILNDGDALPVVSISDAGGFERADGSVGTMTFVVTLSNASSTPVFVDFSTQDFTANAGVDYRPLSGTLTFAPGETQKEIKIEILPDTAFTVPGNDVDQETLFINLTSVQGATSGDTQGLGTIFEPRIVTVANTFADGEGVGTSQATFAFQLVDSNGQPTFVPQGQQITVNYNTVNGTAVAGSDYIATSGTLVFNQFESQQSLPVTVNKDFMYEGDETFFLNLSSTNGTIAAGQAMPRGLIVEAAEVVATRDASGQGVIQVFDYRTNTPRFTFAPFPGFGGEVRVATADFNQDGVPDVVAAAGPNGGPHVKVFNGGDGSLLFEFFAYDPAFLGGVFVATGDVDADGNMDIITGPDMGGGPDLRVFEYDPNAGTVTMTEQIDLSQLGVVGVDFTGGIRVAAGNVTADPGDEIIVGYGPGGVATVEVLNAGGGAISSAFTFNPYGAFMGGVYVSAADIGTNATNNTLDGFADIITGAGAGGGPHVRVFSGADQSVMESFFAYNPAFTGGVRVASGDVADAIPGNPLRDRVSEILTAPGLGGGPHVRAFSVDGLIGTSVADVGAGVFPFSPNLTFGVFVAGRTRGNSGEGSPLRLDPSALPTGEVVPALTQADLQPVVEAAFERLQTAGISEAALNQLRKLEFVVTDLRDDLIGLQTPQRIFIDRTAAGRGYFVDLTPNLDEEFSSQQGRLVATSVAAQGRVDLLTVLLHELGHALGEDHETDANASHELFAPTILPGERRLFEVDHVFSANELFDSLMDLN